MFRSHHKGLTIIELMIVVGIILILAGVASENYIAASFRAKIARVQSDHRTLRVGIEAYSADYNRPPRMAHQRYGDSEFDSIGGVQVSGVMSKALSTPVAYVTSAYLLDPFMERNTTAPLDQRLYTYQVIAEYVRWNPKSTFWPAAEKFYGDWRLAGVGPDLVFDHKFANSAQLPYDPTNGLISLGNVWTGQKKGTDSSLPPIPDLLGSH
ncbi:prepilin-type N-terminal cleavage/methylation domain-containing protein [bacterium]|nr:prepilin-type N-terminal cleavage/methylation domain-containing protein [bacterium]